MRVAWIVAVVLLVVGLAALTTTCTGPRPRPTGETLPADVTAGGVRRDDPHDGRHAAAGRAGLSGAAVPSGAFTVRPRPRR